MREAGLRNRCRTPRREWLPVAGRKALRLAGALGVAVSLSAGVVQAQQTSLTIYQDGRVVVRRTFPVALARGANTVALDLGVPHVDPGTLVALGDGVQITGVETSGATGQDAALRRAVGHEIEFMTQRGDSVHFLRGTLLSLDPLAVRVEGRVVFTAPGTPALPDSLVSLARRVELTVDAARARPSFGLAYLTDGLRWSASYALVVPRAGGGDATGSMAGSATIENPGALTFGAATVQLLAGEVRRAGGPRPVPMAEGVGAMMRAAVAPAPAEEAVGETHVYTLPGTVDLAPGETRTVALFPRAEVRVEPEYLLRHSPYVYQSQQPQAEQDLHPEVSYLVPRPRGTPFGDTPLPAGTVRVFSPDSAGRLQLLGEARIDHTPAGRELHVVTGTAFDITAQRTQLTFEPRGNREAVSSYRVAIQNAGREPVTVQVLEQLPGENDILSSTVPPQRLSASSVRFPVSVPAGGEATLEFRVRVRW